MARFYANENFRRQTVEALIDLGHDVLTTGEAGLANQGISDEDVLSFAKSVNRIVLTFNRKHFIRLHQHNPDHSGIIVCTEDKDAQALAQRIHAALEPMEPTISGQLIRVNRPNTPL